MRPLFLLFPVTLLLGIAVGWFARPVLMPATNLEAIREPPVKAAVQQAGPVLAKPSKSEERPELDEDLGISTAEEEEEETLSETGTELTGMQREIVKRHRAKLEQYAAALGENLQLTPAQRDELQQALDQQLARLEKLISTSTISSKKSLIEILAKVGPDALGELVAAGFTPEQKASYEDFRIREKHRKADVVALKGLSRFQGIFDLKEGQREELYRLLAESAEVDPPQEDPFAVFTETLTGGGWDVDPYGIGVQTLFDESLERAGQGNRKEGLRIFRDAFEQRINEKVEQFRPVLDARQLDLYRAELKAKGMGSLAPIMRVYEE